MKNFEDKCRFVVLFDIAVATTLLGNCAVHNLINLANDFASQLIYVECCHDVQSLLKWRKLEVGKDLNGPVADMHHGSYWIVGIEVGLDDNEVATAIEIIKNHLNIEIEGLENKVILANFSNTDTNGFIFVESLDEL